MKALFWLAVGAGIALMIAPRSGEATRQQVFARINQAFGVTSS